MSPGFPAAMFERFAEFLGADLELETELSGPKPGDDPFADGRFDLGWVCSTSFVDLATREPDPSVQLAGVAWVPDDPDSEGRPVYFGDVVVRAQSPVESLSELAGARIGCNDEVSLSGHHALRFELAERGEDPDAFAELVFTGGHRRSLDMVISGELDAAVVDSVVRIGRARREPHVASLRVITRLGPWPVQPLVARADMPDHQVTGLRDRLLAANDDPGVRRLLAASAITELVAVDASHYDTVRAAMANPA
jgi:ABC-type phosphate/phosphonate transport system substrate-binding protein